MGYVELSTANADYMINGVNHIYTRIPSLEGIDALAVETERTEIMGCSLLGTRDVRRWAEETETPVYSIDVHTTDEYDSLFPRKGKTFFEGLKIMMGDIRRIPYIRRVISHSIRDKKIPDEILDEIARRSMEEREMNVDARNAFAAEKLENHLAPYLSLSTGDRKPFIGVIYGILHMGMIPYLKDENLRKEALDYYQKQSFSGLKLDHINRMLRHTFKNGKENWWESELLVLDVLDKDLIY